MPKEMPLPRYLDKDAKPNTKVVTKGEYIGESEGRFGRQHNFMELDTNEHVVLSGGSLNWRVDNDHMAVGEVFDVIYTGKEMMTKGDYKGKESKGYKYLKYEDSELPAEFLAKRGKPSPAPVAEPGAKSAESEALDDLS
jgi:hypothetical protein